MKALLINGSPRKNGNTHVALSEVARQLEKYGIESEIVWIGTKAVQGCIACYQCGSLGQCAFKDELYLTVREKLKESDALVVGSPTYYGGPNGSLCALLDRLFLSCKADIVNKVWGFGCRMSSWRCQHDIPETEPVCRHEQYGACHLAILEYSLWPCTGRY